MALCILAGADQSYAQQSSADTPACILQDQAAPIKITKTMLAGVPAILRVPTHVTKPPIVLWHGLGPPASEGELMQALPLDEVAAVKVYLGLPLFGERAPPSGSASLAQRQGTDYGSMIEEPVVFGAAKELPAVLRALQEQRCLAPGDKIGLFGFSAGGAAVLFELAERDVPVRAAVVLSAPSSLNVAIDALERVTKKSYVWSPRTRQIAQRSDAIARASDIAAGQPPPALLILHGADDQLIPSATAVSLFQALQPGYRASGDVERLKLIVAPGVAHDWTVSPGLQTLRAAVSDWFKHYL